MAYALEPRNASRASPVTARLRGGLRMELDLGDHLQRAIAADCHERPEEDVTMPLLRPGDLVLDVGANIGYNTLRWAQAVAPEGRVVAFEPVPPNYRALLANVALNPGLPVDIEQLALGDQHGELVMSSDRPGVTAGSYSVKNTAPGGFSVRQLTLDAWAADRDLDRLRLLKIDVEGWEAKVLDGAAKTITRRRPHLMVEWNTGHGETADLARWITRLTNDLGYNGFVIGRSRITGRGTLEPLPTETGDWPVLCNLLLSPAPGSR